ncbi:hypothetical protein JW868_02705, partial [Candidatus Woesearchaeota archaeon]|nr:hypothetical protein [Candidatus Woesearchaeota archaeon]
MAEDDLGAAEYYRSAYNQDWFQEAHNRFTEVCRGYPVEFDQLVIDSLPQKDHVRILDIGAGSADQRV